jgi:hypothetical protein
LPGEGAGLASVGTTEANMTNSNKPKTAKSKLTKVTQRGAPKSGPPKATSTKITSKSDQILNLLCRKQGASLQEMQKASGWQAHSVRGFLAGTVKKRLGLKLTSEKANGDVRHYYVAQA